MYSGIDVSSNNGVLDWDKIKASGVEFAIIRIGYGSDFEKQDDSQAIRNMSECERLGIPYGVYIYSYALTFENAKSEATHTLRMINGYTPKLGVYFDMEDADAYKAKHGINVYTHKQLLTDICKIYCDAIKEAGYEVGIYANKNYWDSVLLKDQLTAYKVWLAHWGISEPSMECELWQYTSDGSVDGSSARTDMNYFYGELPAVVEPEPQPEVESGLAVGTPCTIAQGAKQYGKKSGFAKFVYSTEYTVISVNGDRVVFGINGAVTGATDISNIIVAGEPASEPQTESEPASISVGANCQIKDGATQYGSNNGFADFVYKNTYNIIQVNGDRVVFGVGNAVTGATDVSNIILV